MEWKVGEVWEGRWEGTEGRFEILWLVKAHQDALWLALSNQSASQQSKMNWFRTDFEDYVAEIGPFFICFSNMRRNNIVFLLVLCRVWHASKACANSEAKSWAHLCWHWRARDAFWFALTIQSASQSSRMLWFQCDFERCDALWLVTANQNMSFA